MSVSRLNPSFKPHVHGKMAISKVLHEKIEVIIAQSQQMLPGMFICADIVLSILCMC